jgi:pimeloyl-ACP methyl ester carboxylesterase
MPYADVNDIRMYYEEAGRGAPLILMHGGIGGIDAMSGWSKLAARFAEHYHVFTVEHRGHGRTDNPAGRMSFALIADDMTTFIGRQGSGPVHLAGVSDGATVGLAIGMTRPHLLRSLVAVGPSIYVDDQLRESLRFFDPELIGRDHPEYANIFEKRHDPHHYPGYWRDLVRKVRATVETELAWTEGDLRRHTVPTLLIFGENDVFVSRAQMLAMRDWLPRAELLILNHAGLDGLSNHLPQFTRPEVIEPVIIEFLSRQAGMAA